MDIPCSKNNPFVFSFMHWRSTTMRMSPSTVVRDRSVIGDELQNWPVRESFIVRRPVHRGNPTFSAWEVLIQWHEEPLRRETARLQWMTRTSLGATSSSRRSNNTCCHCLHNRWFFRWTLPLVPPGVRPRTQ